MAGLEEAEPDNVRRRASRRFARMHTKMHAYPPPQRVDLCRRAAVFFCCVPTRFCRLDTARRRRDAKLEARQCCRTLRVWARGLHAGRLSASGRGGTEQDERADKAATSGGGRGLHLDRGTGNLPEPWAAGAACATTRSMPMMRASGALWLRGGFFSVHAHARSLDQQGIKVDLTKSVL